MERKKYSCLYLVFYFYVTIIFGAPTTGPFLYFLARQCRIKRLSFSTMAGVHACSQLDVLCRKMCMVTSATYTVADIPPIGSGGWQTPIATLYDGQMLLLL